MYRLAPSRWARRPKQPAKRSRNLPSRSSTARADNTDKSTGQQHTKLVQKSTVRIIGSLVRKTESDKVLLIGTPHPTPAKAAEFRRVDLASIGAATSASQRAGVRHLVY